MKIKMVILASLFLLCGCSDKDKESKGEGANLDEPEVDDLFYIQPIDIEPPDVIADPPPATVTDWKIKDEDGEIRYFKNMEEAKVDAKKPENYRSILSYKDKNLFATGSLVLIENTKRLNFGSTPLLESTPIYDNLLESYKNYHQGTQMNLAFATIGPGARAGFYVYLYPMDLVAFGPPDCEGSEYDWFLCVDWDNKNPNDPLKEHIFVKIAIEGRRDLYIHSDFIKDLVLLKNAADLYHYQVAENNHTTKASPTEKLPFREMVLWMMWPEDGEPADRPPVFRKKPQTANFKSYQSPLDLAPSWMQNGFKYYSYDMKYFYTDTDDMYKDIFDGDHQRSTNKNDKYINIYSHLNVFKESIYTIDEYYEYIDKFIDETQANQALCRYSILTDHLPNNFIIDNPEWATCDPPTSQKDTFISNEIAQTGVNLGAFLAASHLESGFGRTDETYDDFDPFNHQTGWSRDCEIIKMLINCGKSDGEIYIGNIENCVRDEPPKECHPEIITTEIIEHWPIYWKGEMSPDKDPSKGPPKLSIIGSVGGGMAQGYNPAMDWGHRVSSRYYFMDRWLGFKERNKIKPLLDANPNWDQTKVPFSDQTLILIEPGD